MTTGSGRNRKTTKVCTDSVSTYAQIGGTSYAQGPANQYSRLDKVDGNGVSSGSALRWDKNGNLTEDAAFAYRYDWQNRLALVTKKIKVPAPRRGDRDDGRFSEFVIASPEGARQSMPSGDSDESSVSEDDDSIIAEPVFPPYAERPLVSYRYDALGRRVQTRTSPKFQLADGTQTGAWIPGAANANQTLAQAPSLTGGTLTFTVFAGQNDVAKLDSKSRPTKEYAYAAPFSYDAPVAAFTGKITAVPVYNAAGKRTGTKDVTAWGTMWYHLDRLGSVIAISDASGSVLEQYRYDPFGKPYALAALSATNPILVWKAFGSSKFGNAKLYTGRDWDASMKAYWYRARTFSPSLGRFLQRDPLGYADGTNPYAYVGNGPWGAIDPNGKEKLLIRAHEATMQVVDYFNVAGRNVEYNYNLMGVLGSAVYINKHTATDPTYNLKNNELLIKRSIQDESGNYSKYIYIGETKVHLATLGNMLFGYNVQKGHLSYDLATSIAYLINLDKEARRSDSFFTDNPIINNYFNEREDNQAYAIGYSLAEQTKTGELTASMLEQAVINANTLQDKARNMPFMGEYFEDGAYFY